MQKIRLKGLSREELATFIHEIGEKPFRVTQLWSWMYHFGVTSFDEMSNISKALRSALERIAEIESLMLLKESGSSHTKTRKFLWQLEDGLKVESVFIPESGRRTVCISTQVGCKLKCAFCATGTMGFIRNLEPWEIIDQVISVRRQIGETLSNIVVMGMGEPFLNFENLLKALYIIKDEEGIAIGRRKITISTAGVAPRIRQYTDEKHPFQLAVSLNATTNEVRDKLMPINRKYPIHELVDAIRYYAAKSRKRPTIEYVLLSGVNDTAGDAKRLLELLEGIPCKVNLIAFNPTSDKFKRPTDEHVQWFGEQIRPLCAPVTLRLSKGDDIDAACGQLAVRE